MQHIESLRVHVVLYADSCKMLALGPFGILRHDIWQQLLFLMGVGSSTGSSTPSTLGWSQWRVPDLLPSLRTQRNWCTWASWHHCFVTCLSCFSSCFSSWWACESLKSKRHKSAKTSWNPAISWVERRHLRRLRYTQPVLYKQINKHPRTEAVPLVRSQSRHILHSLLKL